MWFSLCVSLTLSISLFLSSYPKTFFSLTFYFFLDSISSLSIQNTKWLYKSEERTRKKFGFTFKLFCFQNTSSQRRMSRIIPKGEKEKELLHHLFGTFSKKFSWPSLSVHQAIFFRVVVLKEEPFEVCYHAEYHNPPPFQPFPPRFFPFPRERSYRDGDTSNLHSSSLLSSSLRAKRDGFVHYGCADFWGKETRSQKKHYSATFFLSDLLVWRNIFK